MKITKTKSFKTFSEPLLTNNPVSVQILGICSALAVTVQLKTSVVMALSLTFVVSFSSLIISAMRNLIPRNIRIIVELTVVASLVIIADQLLKAFMYDVSKQLSVFVGLIITNCIVLGRAETYAMSHPPHLSFLDGLGNGLGYGAILVLVGFMRELLGSGKLFGIGVVPDFAYNAGYENMGFMLLAPGAFIMIGLLAWLQNTVAPQKEQRK
ncbi:NADH:ubiquinone reductase (Na(+)-transporting) s ubunit D [Desulfonema ishimotonii]|uniref:Na(+)-translocating NADH-quinone reductase subunit D n=1 Tax=Desulfonema ishimotonii TaxID=45657 RepID=A0A401G2C4_9BACT|nr:NADH:ubiquinone reductase (Na(+)-transporting) subunit D [Desulfonema ishimotonii]GBC63377.1 NADH:ubiquinone reductase (Na(+)-transporting) s ubunit D [Desulfonema ishimotonii]